MARIWRFVSVGCIAAASFFGLSYAMQSEWGIAPFAASAASYLVVFVCAYLAQSFWSQRGKIRHGVSFWRYAALQLICAGVAGFISHVTQLVGLSAIAASAASTVVTGMLALALTLQWVFPSGSDRQP